MENENGIESPLRHEILRLIRQHPPDQVTELLKQCKNLVTLVSVLLKPNQG